MDGLTETMPTGWVVLLTTLCRVYDPLGSTGGSSLRRKSGRQTWWHLRACCTRPLVGRCPVSWEP